MKGMWQSLLQVYLGSIRGRWLHEYWKYLGLGNKTNSIKVLSYTYPPVARYCSRSFEPRISRFARVNIHKYVLTYCTLNWQCDTICGTAEPATTATPRDQAVVAFQGRWSLVTGWFEWKACFWTQSIGLSRHMIWPFFRGDHFSRFYCTNKNSKANVISDLFCVRCKLTWSACQEGLMSMIVINLPRFVTFCIRRWQI